MHEPVARAAYPALAYDDAHAAIAWLCRVFGLRKRLVVPGDEEGIVRHSELSFGQAVVMVSSPRPEEQRYSPRTLGGHTQSLSLYVADPDAHHDRAVAEGAEITQPLESAPHGARGYSAVDPEGHHWHFSDYVPGAWWDAAGDA